MATAETATPIVSSLLWSLDLQVVKLLDSCWWPPHSIAVLGCVPLTTPTWLIG